MTGPGRRADYPDERGADLCDTWREMISIGRIMMLIESVLTGDEGAKGRAKEKKSGTFGCPKVSPRR